MAPAVLITGAARRLGAMIARGFGEAGWHVIIHYGRSRDDAEALAANLPSAETVHCPLDDAGAVASMAAALATRLDDWRVLVNSASVFRKDGAERVDDAVMTQAMAINLVAPVRLAQAFLAHARARGGRRVISLTDQKLANPNPDFFSYSASKHALGAASVMLAMAQPRPEDRVYALAPGAILASHDQTEAEAERSHRMNLLGRRTGADEIADAARFLAEGWLASGTTLFVDSGQHLLAQPRDIIYLARG